VKVVEMNDPLNPYPNTFHVIDLTGSHLYIEKTTGVVVQKGATAIPTKLVLAACSIMRSSRLAFILIDSGYLTIQDGIIYELISRIPVSFATYSSLKLFYLPHLNYVIMRNSYYVELYDVSTNTKLALNYDPGAVVSIKSTTWIHPLYNELLLITTDGKISFLRFTATTITPFTILTVSDSDKCYYSDYLRGRNVFMIAC
jgi:hypothetical protein